MEKSISDEHLIKAIYVNQYNLVNLLTLLRMIPIVCNTLYSLQLHRKNAMCIIFIEPYPKGVMKKPSWFYR